MIYFKIKTLMAVLFLLSCQSPVREDKESSGSSAESSPLQADSVRTDLSRQQGMLVVKLGELYKEDLSKQLIDSFSRRYYHATIYLNGDNEKEIFIGHTGTYFCGSGGCTVLLLNAGGDLITRFSVTDTPILVAGEKSNLWSDLLIYSNGKFHRMKYNGKSYPTNPSIEPVVSQQPAADLPKVLDYIATGEQPLAF